MYDVDSLKENVAPVGSDVVITSAKVDGMGLHKADDLSVHVDPSSYHGSDREG